MTTRDGSFATGVIDLAAVSRRLRDLNEQVVSQAKKNGLTFVEGYEQVLEQMLDLEQQTAKGTGQAWVMTLAATHAAVVRETSRVFLGAVEDLLRS
ncbi:MAG TPA: hypothetical protein VD834_13875 [Blastococcus sp.]|nr:hypothetical protein [Blastococcus sp.]